jgi:hypothetical protein
MYESKREPGRKFGSAFVGRRHDEAHSEPKARTESVDVKAPHAVVEEHGAATKVEVTHDHEGGKHSLKSQHPDGFENASEHSSPKEAYDEATKLADEQGHHGMGASSAEENFVSDDLV